MEYMNNPAVIVSTSKCDTISSMLLTLIRHGRSSDMQENKSQSPESGLSEQSILVLSEMRHLVDQYTYDAVYTSNYKRAQQSAELLFDKEIVKVLDYVHESDMTPHLRGKTYEEVYAYWKSLDDTVKYDDNFRHGDDQVRGESFNELIQRTDSFISFLFEHHGDNEHVALVGHGHFFRVLIARLMQPEVFNYRIFSQFMRFFDLENGSATTVEINRKTKRGVIREMNNWEIM